MGWLLDHSSHGSVLQSMLSLIMGPSVYVTEDSLLVGPLVHADHSGSIHKVCLHLLSLLRPLSGSSETLKLFYFVLSSEIHLPKTSILPCLTLLTVLRQPRTNSGHIVLIVSPKFPDPSVLPTSSSGAVLGRKGKDLLALAGPSSCSIF
jgi:hypothetical protein